MKTYSFIISYQDRISGHSQAKLTYFSNVMPLDRIFRDTRKLEGLTLHSMVVKPVAN